MTDLPEGYRWATEEETEANLPDAIVVPRTIDSTGRPYEQGEADVAVPVEDFEPLKPDFEPLKPDFEPLKPDFEPLKSDFEPLKPDFEQRPVER